MFKRINPMALDMNVFTTIAERWMLVTAGTPERCNTMTASWGGLGILWNKPMATIYIRPQRYTRQFVDAQEYFTLAFFPPEYRKALGVCGSKSGRDIDKVKECGFTLAWSEEGGAPYFEEAELVLVCRKRMTMPMDPDAIPAEIKEKNYRGDYHYIYWGEIVEALVRED